MVFFARKRQGRVLLPPLGQQRRGECAAKAEQYQKARCCRSFKNLQKFSKQNNLKVLNDITSYEKAGIDQSDYSRSF